MNAHYRVQSLNTRDEWEDEVYHVSLVGATNAAEDFHPRDRVRVVHVDERGAVEVLWDSEHGWDVPPGE